MRNLETAQHKKKIVAMAEVVRLNLERMIPELEELRDNGIFNEVRLSCCLSSNITRISTNKCTERNERYRKRTSTIRVQTQESWCGQEGFSGLYYVRVKS